MNTVLFAVVTLVLAPLLAFRPSAYAQNMEEYSTLPTTPTTVSKAISATSREVAKKAASLNGAMSQNIPKSSASSEKSALTQSVPAPTPPAVFILSNGDRLESGHYLLTVSSLCLQQGDTRRTVPLSAVNLDATIAANHERGIDLKIPKNRSEVMLSF